MSASLLSNLPRSAAAAVFLAAASAALAQSSVTPAPAESEAAEAETVPPQPKQPLTEDQVAKILQQIEELQENVRSSATGNNARVKQILLQAASSPKSAVDLHYQCKEGAVFEKIAEKQAEFRNWRDREASFVELEDWSIMLQMKLLFLVATIDVADAAAAGELGAALPSVERFLEFYTENEHHLSDPEEVFNRRDDPKHDQMMDSARRPVLDSPYARHFQLDASVKPPADWPKALTETDELWEAVPLAWYRQQANGSKLMAAWDSRINQLKTFIQYRRDRDHNGSGQYEEILRLTHVKLPSLAWARLRDMFTYANQTEATAAMLSHLKQHSSHPDAQAWIEELQTLLNPNAATGSGAAVPTSGSAGTGDATGLPVAPAQPPESDRRNRPPVRR